MGRSVDMGQLITGQIHDLRQLNKGFVILQRSRIIVDQIIHIADMIMIDDATIKAFQQMATQTGLYIIRKGRPEDRNGPVS